MSALGQKTTKCSAAKQQRPKVAAIPIRENSLLLLIWIKVTYRLGSKNKKCAESFRHEVEGARMTIKHLLEQKGQNVWTIDPDATVFDALAKMAEKNVGSLVVMDGEKLIGIITERHYSRNVILKGKTSPSTLVRDIMERNVIHVRPEQSVDLCMALMTEKRVRHLPVVEDTSVIGIVSIGDLLKFMISKKEFDIEQLEHYIQGGRAA
jgi:CBS domain-containing protein